MVSPWNVLLRAGEMLAFLRSLIIPQGILDWGAWHLPWHCQILPKEPLPQPSPGLPKQTDAWPRGNSLLSLEHIPGTFSSSGYQKTQKSQSSCRDGQPSFPKPAKPPGTLQLCRGNLGRLPQHACHWFRDLLGQWQDSSSYPGAGV